MSDGHIVLQMIAPEVGEINVTLIRPSSGATEHPQIVIVPYGAMKRYFLAAYLSIEGNLVPMHGRAVMETLPDLQQYRIVGGEVVDELEQLFWQIMQHGEMTVANYGMFAYVCCQFGLFLSHFNKQPKRVWERRDI